MASSVSRRSFLRGSALAASALGLGGAPLLRGSHAAHAQQRPSPPPGSDAEDAVMINANEHPLGPSAGARQAITDIAAKGGRYLGGLQNELVEVYAAQLGVPVDHVMGYAGSTEPLDYTMLAFTSPTASLVTADPTFESGWRAATRNGASVHKLPLRADHSHDVEAMCAKDPKAGVIYICNPNNPTGSVTLRRDLEYALANKPRGGVLVVDEAYIHFSENVVSAVDMVAAGEDVVVLRTFSKLYGMAGIRLGFAVARPELLERLKFYSVNSLPVTAAAAGLASLRDPELVPKRRRETARIRTDVMGWLAAKGYSCTASESNCFMVDVKRPASGFIVDMAAQRVFVGRAWPIWPNASRITIGTAEEMERFKAAFERVEASATATVQAVPEQTGPWQRFFEVA
jgi:histidinol-phosphate aminotransferase